MERFFFYFPYALNICLNKLASLLTTQRIILFSRLALIAIITVLVLVILFSYNDFHERILYGQDFRVFLGAGKIMLEGEPFNLYDPGTQLKFQEKLGFDSEQWPLAPYLNPPVYAWVMQIFALLPYFTAVTAWRIISILLAFFSIKKVIEVLKLDTKSSSAVIILLASFPGFMAVYNGQNTFFFLAIYAGVYILLSKGQDFHAGAVLGLGFLKPQLFWLMPVLLLFQKRWRAFQGGILTFSLLSLASFSLVGMDGVISYIEFLNSSEYNWFVNWRLHDMHSLAAFISLSAGQDLEAINHLIVVTMLLFGLGVYLKLSKINLDPGEIITISIIGTLLLNPHLFHYDLSLLALPYLFMLSWMKGNTLNAYYLRNLQVVMFLLYLYLWFSSLVIQTTGLQLSVLLLLYMLFLVFNKISARNRNRPIFKIRERGEKCIS